MTQSSDRRRAELAVLEAARNLCSRLRLRPPSMLSTADDKLVEAMIALEKIDLEPATRARAGGPLLTSQNAAAFVDGARAQSIIGRILRQLDLRHGLTVEELCVDLAGKHQTISARVHELWRQGWVRPNGERPTSSGQSATVWQIAPEARLALVAGRSDAARAAGVPID